MKMKLKSKKNQTLKKKSGFGWEILDFIADLVEIIIDIIFD